ncbi:MAG: amino acid racemase [Marinibacterium sp.]|nr:amino acid racemase [Marinibacterium sp.]
MTPIGILGGMGPEATLLLMQKLLDAVPARDDADHVPLIVHQNPQVPSRIKALIDGTGDDPGPVLARMARDLQAAGAGVLAMPCNTAHHYARHITQASDLPFLDMVELTAAHLAGAGVRRVGMLASPAVRLTDAFGPGFARHGLSALFPEDDAPVLALIRAVKAGQSPDPAALAGIARSLMDQGADHILVACTELSLLAETLPEGIAWTDSLDCLTRAILRSAGKA